MGPDDKRPRDLPDFLRSEPSPMREPPPLPTTDRRRPLTVDEERRVLELTNPVQSPTADDGDGE